MVKVLCYKSEGRWFDLSWCQWHKILPIALRPWGQLSLEQKWVPGAFPRGKGGRCVRLTTLPPSCAVVMKSGNLNFLEPSGPLQACNRTALHFYHVPGGDYCCRCTITFFCCHFLKTEISLPSVFSHCHSAPSELWRWKNTGGPSLLGCFIFTSVNTCRRFDWSYFL